jgi:hypothetical protein
MKILLLAIAAGVSWGQTPDIEEIMRRVALNQAKSLELRTNYVYHQKQLLRMIRGTKKVAREEVREYTITPKFRGNDRQLVYFEGKYEKNGKYLDFTEPGFKHKDLDLDGELLKELSDDMMHDKDGKDGISNDLFPLTYHRQQKYDFKFLKTENHKGAKAWRIHFQPKAKPTIKNLEDGAIWKGEALIDAEEYQPIQVASQMAWKMPMAVRTLLGTNLHGVGFTVNYQKFEDGLWFPVSYGGEFELRAVFLYHRIMTINMTNSDFRRTNVQSNVAYATDEEKDK